MSRLLLITLLAAGALQAQWPGDPALNFAVCGRDGEQTLPKVAATHDGGCYVSWEDLASGNYDVYLQRLDAQGVAQWAADGIAVSTHPQDTWITDYDLAVDQQDNAILAFNDIRDGADRDIFAYRVSPAGEQLWGPDGLTISANEGFEPDPQICVTTEGNVVFAWQEDSVLHLRKVDAAGQDLWDPHTVTLTDEYPLSIPRLASAPEDGVLLQYLKALGTQFWSPKHLYVQRFDAAGQQAWAGLGAPIETLGGFGPQMRPDLAADGAGGAWCHWYETRGGQLHAFAQHLMADGSVAWTVNGVQLSTTATELQDQPRLVVDPQDGEAVVELYYRITDLNQGLSGVAGQRLSPSGERLWGEGGLLLHPLASEYRHSVVAARSGDSTLVGHLAFPAGDVVNSRLVVESVTNEGLPGWAPVEAASTVSDKGYLTAAATTAGQLVAVWQDTRDDASGDILLQNVNPDGSLGPWQDTWLPPPPRPAQTHLLSAWPNPFNPATSIHIALHQAGPIRITCHDILGQEVARLADGWQPAGERIFHWDGSRLNSGIYWIRLEADGHRDVLRTVLIK